MRWCKGSGGKNLKGGRGSKVEEEEGQVVSWGRSQGQWGKREDH